MAKRSSGGCCGDGSPGLSASSKQIKNTQKFGLTNPIAGCVPAEAMQNLPEFLQWFSKDATPILCAAQAIKDNPCMVLAGGPMGYRGIAISDLMAECGVSGQITCANVAEKFAYNKADSCIPTKNTEKATMVLSADLITGELAWRYAPDIECDTLSDFLKPAPISPVGCFPLATASDIPDKVFTLTKSGALVWASASGGGSAVSTDCTAIKTALGGSCIQSGVVASVIGLDASNVIVKTDRRRLVLATFAGANVTPDVYSDTLTNHGNSVNRRVWKWQNDDSGVPALAPGQYLGDMVYNATTRTFTIGHGATYQFSTSIFVSASSSATELATSLSLLAGFRIDRTTGAQEFRFGEITQDLGGDDSLKSNSDYVFSGTWQGYLPAGSTVAVRFWAAPGPGSSGSKVVNLTANYTTSGSIFTIAELPAYG